MAADRKEVIEQITVTLKECVYKLNDLLGYMDAGEDIAEIKRSRFILETNENRGKK